MSALIKLDDFKSLKNETQDKTLKKLVNLYQLQLDIPKTVCLGINSLKAIAEANNLRAKIFKLTQDTRFTDPVSQTNFKKHLLNIFLKLEIPREISQEIIKTYQQYFEESMVRVFGGEMLSSSPMFKNIVGEMNLIESLALLWHSLVEDKIRYAGPNLPFPNIIYSAPLFIQQQGRAKASGKVYSINPVTGDKHQIVVKSSWGAEPMSKDKFEVDSRTFQIISRDIGTQEKKAIRKKQYFSHHELQTQEVIKSEQQTKPSLSDEQVSKLAKLVQNIKQKFLHQISLDWELVDDEFIIINLEEVQVSPITAQNKLKPTSFKTATKLFISTGNPALAGQVITDKVDGVGVMRSEYSFASFGLHPLHVINSRKHKALVNKLAETIKNYQQVLKGRPLIYRSINLNSQEMKRLSFAETFEPAELNPFLGIRGALKNRIYPEIFELELEALEKNLEESHGNISLLIPFVRTPSELAETVKKVKDSGLLENHNFNLWLQLNTPENILNLAAYPLKDIAGLSINAKTINALLHGYDPDNPEVSSHYQMNRDVLKKLIRQVANLSKISLQSDSIYQQKKILLHLEEFDRELASFAVEVGLFGVTVKSKSVDIAKSCIMDEESLLMGKGR